MTTLTETAASTPAGRPAEGYIPALDGLRAIAVLLVLAFHLAMPFTFAGGFGVDMFFVLSGFLISTILLKEVRRTGTIEFRSFYIRRFIRLYPAMLAVAAVIIPAGLLIVRDIPYFLSETLFALTYTTPVAQLADSEISNVWRMTWTLGVEEFFYLVWPVVLLALLRRWKPSLMLSAAVAAAGFAILLLIRVAEVLNGSTPDLFRGGGLLIGAALAIALASNYDRRIPTWASWVGLVLIIGAVTIGTVRFPNSLTIIMAVSGTALIVCHIAQRSSGGIIKILSLGPVTYLGRISYELYLWHWPVLVLVREAIGSQTHFELAWAVGPISLALAATTHALLSPRIDGWKAHASRHTAAV